MGKLILMNHTSNYLNSLGPAKAFSYDPESEEIIQKEEYFVIIDKLKTKDDESTKSKSVIGQFGTGFISTHILSTKITVSGVVEDSEEDEYFNFSFDLDRSERKDNAFIVLSTSAFTGENLEIELFGTEELNSSGKLLVRPGLLERANGGTLLIKGISQLNSNIQFKLIQFIKDKKSPEAPKPDKPAQDERHPFATGQPNGHAVS